MAETKSKLERKAKKHIQKEIVIWLTTVGRDASPQPRPVWFIWDKDSFLIYSQPHARKVAHVKEHPNVALHFNTDASGDQDVIVYTGRAMVDSDAPPPHKVPAYLRKYRQGIADLGMTPEQFGGEYSVAIRVRPSSLRGW